MNVIVLLYSKLLESSFGGPYEGSFETASQQHGNKLVHAMAQSTLHSPSPLLAVHL
jgi:hypothetical protein